MIMRSKRTIFVKYLSKEFKLNNIKALYIWHYSTILTHIISVLDTSERYLEGLFHARVERDEVRELLQSNTASSTHLISDVWVVEPPPQLKHYTVVSEVV